MPLQTHALNRDEPQNAVWCGQHRVLQAGWKRSGSRGSVDVRGALLVTTAIAALIFGLSSGQQHGFTAPATIIALALAVLLTTGFVFAEKRSAAPMLPLSILAEPARRAAIAAMLLIGAILAGYVYFASLYMQKGPGQRPGTGWGAVHHQPADRRRGRAGDPRHRRRRGHRRPRRLPGGRLPPVVPDRDRSRSPRRDHRRAPAQLEIPPG